MADKKKSKSKADSKPKSRGSSADGPVIKMRGYVTWFYLTGEDDGTYDRFEVERAVYRDGRELAIDCNCASPSDQPYVYTINLLREDSLLFRGEWVAGRAADRDSGICSCRVYSNGDRLAFAGVWKQNGSTEHWFGELLPIEESDGNDAE